MRSEDEVRSLLNGVSFCLQEKPAKGGEAWDDTAKARLLRSIFADEREKV